MDEQPYKSRASNGRKNMSGTPHEQDPASLDRPGRVRFRQLEWPGGRGHNRL